MNAISQKFLNACAKNFAADSINGLRMRAVVKNGLSAAAENHVERIDNPFVFSTELTTGDITSQNQSGRCWLFAALNTMRYTIIKKLNLKNFELSQNYPMFWDKLEKANYFLENILATMNETTDSRIIIHLLTAPLQDGGQWDMFCALVDKYGCVPKAVMPETFHSSNTNQMNALMTLKLQEDAKILRDAHAKGATMAKLRACKEKMLEEIYRILCICLGEPPKTFTFEIRDKDQKYIREENLTPKSFYDKYIGKDLDDYVSVINAPTADKPYGRSFTVSMLGNVIGGRQIKYLNLPVDELKKLAIKQLNDNEPVWYGSDVGKMLLRDKGIMGTHTFDYESLLGVSFGLDKAGRLDYRSSCLTHAMVLLGVNMTNGKPDRWKVENSWGEKNGERGFYIMTDDWFSEYAYQVVIHRKYLTAKQKAAYDAEPIVLAPWDPMGSLA